MKFDPREITAQIPGILCKPDRRAAFTMATQGPPNQSILPEIMTLFATRGLSGVEMQQMLHARFSGTFDRAESLILGSLNGDLGRLGFSFPQWRYLTQSFNGAALVERFGMERLHRPTDVRDESLPKSDPARDLFGTGFAIQTARHYIELRRAYILCSTLDQENPASLIIRNNSYFFGRDRLPQPVYVSFEPKTVQALQGLDLTTVKKFQGWKAFMAQSDGRAEKAELLRGLIDEIDAFDKKFSKWLVRDGRTDFLWFLDKPRDTPIYIAAINTKMPPWYPRFSIPLVDQPMDGIKTSQMAKQLKRDGWKMVLLSGENGDFPVTPRP